ncbi:hypothetical protein D3C78_1654920 [compost metagenome]
MVVQQGQCLIDIAIQHCGDASAAFAIAALNGLSVTDDVLPGVDLLIPEILDKGMTDYFLKNGFVPATGSVKPENYTLSGIDYMGIEIDFIVS